MSIFIVKAPVHCRLYRSIVMLMLFSRWLSQRSMIAVELDLGVVNARVSLIRKTPKRESQAESTLRCQFWLTISADGKGPGWS
jgi:hypothetical protein